MSDLNTNTSGLDASENGTEDVSGLPTSGTVQTETPPADRPKIVVNDKWFPRFTMPRLRDGWTESMLPGSEMFSIYKVDNGTYFDESIVVDEYASFLGN